MKIKTLLSTATLCVASLLTLSSCSKKEETAAAPAAISQSTMAQIKALGFSTQDVKALDGGYLVEGDIHLTEADLKSKSDYKVVRVGDTEHYRTYNLVGGLPRRITLSVSTSLPYSYVAAVDEVVRRYNAEGLLVTFSRVSSNADITFTRAASGMSYLAYSGFPSYGNPYNTVVVNTDYLGTNPNTNYLATILTHEVGHCIGFRHTDFGDRSYSCGGQYSNEGASNIGAVYIPGTPNGPEPYSWMLACINYNVNRPFDYYDRVALNYLY